MKQVTHWFVAVTFAIPIFATGAEFPAEEIYKTFSPAVVVVSGAREKGGGSLGTGSIIDARGLVLTNAHVILDDTPGTPYPNMSVYLRPAKVTGDQDNDLKRHYNARVLRYDRALDLALVSIENFDQKTRLVELAKPENVNIGQDVVAIGHPEQGGFWTLTYGRISTVKKDVEGVVGKDVYQTDTSINRGNSGGPLLDRYGHLVGINTSMARVSRDGMPITGVNFSIQSAVVKKWLTDVGYPVAYANIPNTEPVAPAPEQKPEPTTPPKSTPDKRFETPKYPYNYEKFIAVEKELSDMMEEMRIKR